MINKKINKLNILKNKLALKISYKKISLLFLIIFFTTINTAFCGTISSNYPTIEQAENLVRMLDGDEVNEFNRQMNLGLQDYNASIQNVTPKTNSLIPTILFAIAANVVIIFVARYASTAWDILVNAAGHTADVATGAIIDTARELAYNRVRNLRPDQVERAINILEGIINRRGGGAA